MEYRLGNLLRGGYAGAFDNIDDAWLQLGTKFLATYPCSNDDSGRHVQLIMTGKNRFGFNDDVLCKSEYFNMKDKLDNVGNYKYLPEMFFF